jgi:hypothetical protein
MWARIVGRGGIHSQRMQEFPAPCGLWGLIKRERNPLEIDATHPCKTKRVASDPQIDKQFLECL